MRTVRKLALLGIAIPTVATAFGCVSRDELLRTEFARRKAVERADALERDLADERSRVLALESEREALKRQLDDRTALYETTLDENKRLQAFVDKLQGQMDDVLKKGMGGIEVVEVKLPPELDRALKDLAAKYPDVIEYDARKGAVRWKSDLTFDKGSDKVRETALASLRAFSDIVNSAAASAFEVVVVGHTDNLPIGPITARQHPSNWHLSVHRAISVMFALKGNGVGYERMGCMGYGEHRPRVPNPARGGSEQNRRVEIFLVSGKEHVPGMDTAMYRNPNDGSVYTKIPESDIHAAPREETVAGPTSDDPNAGDPNSP
jgi:chemotaxis protein MotB